MTAVGISPRQEPENSKNVTWVYLPASKGQIERAMQRSGITEPKDMRLWIADSSFPEEVDVAPVSYTHLDVYKRQGPRRAGASIPVSQMAVGPSAPPVMPMEAAAGPSKPRTMASRNAQ